VTLTSSLSAVDILDQAQSGRLVLQDFRPLAESLEWELGQEFYRDRGSQAFIGPEPVPWVVNNDGNQSIRAAEVFFTSLLAAEQEGTLPEDVFVRKALLASGCSPGTSWAQEAPWKERLASDPPEHINDGNRIQRRTFVHRMANANGVKVRIQQVDPMVKGSEPVANAILGARKSKGNERRPRCRLPSEGKVLGVWVLVMHRESRPARVCPVGLEIPCMC
jgi:hypothetical protein